MFRVDLETVHPLPEAAFEVTAIEELGLWFNGELTVAPAWLKQAARALQPIERRALVAKAQIGWAIEAAKARLRLAALEQDGVTINASMQEELAQLDRRLRLLAKAEGQEDVLAQLGQIRLALRPHLVMKLERRDRVAFAGSRAVR